MISRVSLLLFLFKNPKCIRSYPLQNMTSITRPLNESLKDSVEPVIVKRQSANESVQAVKEVTQQSVIADYKKGKKKFMRIAICGIVLFLFGLFLFLLLPVIITSQIHSQIGDQVILTQDSQGMWAHYPGTTGTVITRNYTFMKFLNQQQFLLHGQKPKFMQIGQYKIWEQEDFIDISYNEDQTIVKFRDWLHFENFNQTRSLEQKIPILNVPSLGYWYILKNSRPQLVMLEGFSTLFVSIADTIKDVVMGEGLKAQFLTDFNTTYSQLLQPAGISLQNSQFMWEDKTYGLQDFNNYKYWMQAIRTSFTEEQPSFSTDALNLKDYFTLDDQQMYLVMKQLGEYVEGLQNIVFKNFYCQNLTVCNGNQFAIQQMANSFITLKTPPIGAIVPSDTICETNKTCKDYFPEIGAFYKRVYLVKYPQEDPFLQFDAELVRKWLDYNPSKLPNQWNKNQSAFFHIGNLDALWENGTLHDKIKKTHIDSTPYLTNIKNRFQLPSDEHARVFWEWAKYLINDVLRQGTGNNQVIGIANTFSPTMAREFAFLQDNLQMHLLKTMIKNIITDKKCNQFLGNSFKVSSDTAFVLNICKYYDQKIEDDKFLIDSISSCRNKYRKQWNQYIELGANSINLQIFCDKSVEGGFGQIYHKMRVELNQFYKCYHTPYEYCSDYQLASLQWANSTVTLTHPGSAGNSLNKTTTFSDWNPKASAFQYGHFVKKFPNKTMQTFSMNQTYFLMNYDEAFSILANIRRFKNKETSQNWRNYMRYVVVLIGFKGLARERTARQFIFGYDDEYLLSRKTNYPPFGGDPSTPSYTAFNDLNLTREEATLQIQMYTGKDNLSMVGQYKTINGYNYMTTNYSRFNGNQSYWVLETPWAENDYFYGTNGKTFKPDQYGGRNISIYVPNLQRYGSGVLDTTQNAQRYGFQLQIAQLSDSIYTNENDYPDNKKYYQKFTGLLNETGVLGFPFFMSKHQFLNSSDNWTTYVEIQNQSGVVILGKDQLCENSFILYQPYSGVAFQSVLYIQANYYHEPDLLFTYNQTCFLPAFTVYRSGNLTQEKANQLFGQLTTALKAKTVVFVVGIVLTIISVAVIAFAVFKYKKYWKHAPTAIGIGPSLLTSSQISNQNGTKNRLSEPLMKQIQIED